MDYIVKPLAKFNKTITAPADKSITQRAILFGALGEKKFTIHNALLGEDCISSLSCAASLGANLAIDEDKGIITITGRELDSADLNVGNSGTAMRLLTGALAGQVGRSFKLDGDDSIRNRPMKRVIKPLTLMGADLGSEADWKAPISITGTTLSGITYETPMASAQVKSAILLAGLYASGETTVVEPLKSRDHTERLLQHYGVNVRTNGRAVSVNASRIVPCDTRVVGDISSAAFPLVLAAAMQGGSVTVKDVGVNLTRSGLLAVLSQCGANYRIFNKRDEFEPEADIELEHAELKPFNIGSSLIPLLIDEIPILAVLACFINGESTITGAEELKFKESNRIKTVVKSLRKMGADIDELPDGMVIRGNGYLAGGATIDSHGDHRIAMSMAVAGALSASGCKILNAECAAVSYPDFYALFKE